MGLVLLLAQGLIVAPSPTIDPTLLPILLTIGIHPSCFEVHVTTYFVGMSWLLIIRTLWARTCDGHLRNQNLAELVENQV